MAAFVICIDGIVNGIEPRIVGKALEQALLHDVPGMLFHEGIKVDIQYQPLNCGMGRVVMIFSKGEPIIQMLPVDGALPM